jgi:hypothetical protein
MVRHFNSDDEIIQTFFGATVTQLYTSFSPCTITVSFVCNQGDIIRADMQAQVSNGTSVTISIANGFDGVDSEMGISGVPFEPSELQPYDPCDYKNYLYDFEAPLSMSQIQDMLNNPSAPIKFSRTPTINNGINGLCNQVSIDSIIRQNAKFTLRSSQKL